MPKFQIDGADGTYEVEAPDEISAVSAFKKMQGGGAAGGEPDDAAEEARIAANDPGHLKGIGSKLLQGATFGLGDEALAGIKTGFGFLGDYGKQVDREREILSGYEEAHPVISALSEIVGSLPTAGGIAKAGGSLVLRSAGKAAAKSAAAKAAGRTVGTLEKAGDLGKRIGAGGVEGALYGAAYGAGTAEGGLGERAEGALEAAPLGAAVGGAIPAVTTAVGAIGRPIAKAARGFTNPSLAATERVAGAIDADTAASRIAEARKIGQDLGIADVSGAPAQDLLKTAARRSGERGDIAARASLSELSAVDRVKALVGESLNAPEGAYQAAKNMIMDARSTAAKPYYDRFYAQPVEGSDELTAVLSTPNGRSALAEARRNAANRRESALFEAVDDDGNIIPGKVPNARALDETKRVLDAAVNAAKEKADGSPFAKAKDTPKSRAIATVRDDLVKFMDTIGGTRAPGAAISASPIKAALDRFDSAYDEAVALSSKGRSSVNTSPTVLLEDIYGILKKRDPAYSLANFRDDVQKMRRDPDALGSVWDLAPGATMGREIGKRKLLSGEKATYFYKTAGLPGDLLQVARRGAPGSAPGQKVATASPSSRTADGPYAKAREVSGANIREDEAIEFGRKALNTDPRVLARRMGDPSVYGRDKVFTDAERELAQIGLADAIFGKLEKTGSTTQALAAFFKSPAQKAKLRPFFKTEVEFKAFQKQMLAESLKGRTNEIAARASGAPRTLADESPLDAGTAGVARTTVMFGARAGALTAITKALHRVGGMTPKVADKIGSDLMTRDPAQVKAVLARIHALERTKLSKEAKRIRTRRIITDATAGELGRAAAGPTEYRGIE